MFVLSICSLNTDDQPYKISCIIIAVTGSAFFDTRYVNLHVLVLYFICGEQLKRSIQIK